MQLKLSHLFKGMHNACTLLCMKPQHLFCFRTHHMRVTEAVLGNQPQGKQPPSSAAVNECSKVDGGVVDSPRFQVRFSCSDITCFKSSYGYRGPWTNLHLGH